MEPNRLSRKVRAVIAALIVAGSSVPTFAQPPAPLPSEESVEVYYGAAKVTPAPAMTPESIPMIPASAEVESKSRSGEAIAEAMHSVRDGTRDVSAAAVGLLGKAGDRIKHTVDSRPIIIATFTPPVPATIPAPAVTVHAPASPAPVVVMQESEPRPAPAASAPRGLTFNVETIVAFGVGVLGLLLAMMAWARGSRKQAAMTEPFGCAAPKRKDAEKFELGPTYREELQQKQQVEESIDAATVELILKQNLNLLASMNPDAEGTLVHTDEEGFAAPAMA